MGTPFDEVYDLALVSFRDYKLNKIYDMSENNFKEIMFGYLLKAIPNFTNYNLENNLDIDNRKFTILLTLTQKVILGNLIVIEWMNSKILDVTQLQNYLNDTDFRQHSNAQNLKAKMEAREILREVVNQDMTVYGLKNIPWSEWADGKFL